MNRLERSLQALLTSLYLAAGCLVVSALGVLVAVLFLIPLRLVGAIDWSWWLIATPLAPAALIVGLILFEWLSELWKDAKR